MSKEFVSITTHLCHKALEKSSDYCLFSSCYKFCPFARDLLLIGMYCANLFLQLIPTYRPTDMNRLH
jgi:hypothetical protein